MRYLLLVLSILIILPAQAFQDCVISSDGKITNIKIEDSEIIDVCPLVTLTNEKNILIVHPLQEGKTRFCVLKNDKDIVMFDVSITENFTKINDVVGFEIFELDIPDEVFELDLPPTGFNLAEESLDG